MICGKCPWALSSQHRSQSLISEIALVSGGASDSSAAAVFEKPDMALTEVLRAATALTLTRTSSHLKCTPKVFSYREKGVYL